MNFRNELFQFYLLQVDRFSKVASITSAPLFTVTVHMRGTNNK